MVVVGGGGGRGVLAVTSSINMVGECNKQKTQLRPFDCMIAQI